MTAIASQADDCGRCGGPIPYDVKCYMTRTGEVIDGAPVVEFVCAECFEA